MGRQREDWKWRWLAKANEKGNSPVGKSLFPLLQYGLKMGHHSFIHSFIPEIVIRCLLYVSSVLGFTQAKSLLSWQRNRHIINVYVK